VCNLASTVERLGGRGNAALPSYPGIEAVQRKVGEGGGRGGRAEQGGGGGGTGTDL
jgi:hypothetical protein